MKKSLKQLVVVLTIAYCCFISFASYAKSKPVAKQTSTKQLELALRRLEFEKCLQLYDTLPPEKRDGVASYCEGYAFMRLHKLDEAKPFFQKAQEQHFSGFKRWRTSQELLSNIEKYQKLMPPEIEDYFDEKGKPLIKVYAHHSPWTDHLLPEISSFTDRAHEIFGTKVPYIKFVIFKDRSAYDQCCKILFGDNPEDAAHFGTGMQNIVVFCEKGPEYIEETYKDDPTYAVGSVLHEYGHALFRTIMGPPFNDTIPRWIDEGLANIFASPYFKDGLSVQNRDYLETRDFRAPAYLLLAESFYQNDRYLAYSLAEWTLRELFGNNQDKSLYPFLKKACELHDANAAAKVLFKRDLEDAYDKVIEKYWGKKDHTND